MSRTRKWIGLGGKIGLTTAILGFLAVRLPLAEIPAQISQLDLRWLAVAWLCLALSIIISTARWRLLLAVQGLRLSFARLLRLTMIGQFFNAFLLGSTGGDLVLMLYVSRETSTDRGRAALSVIGDRLLGLGGLIVWALAVMPFLLHRLNDAPDLRRILSIVLWLLALIVIAGVAAIVVLARPGPAATIKRAITRLPFGTKAAVGVEAAADCVRHRRLTAQAVAIGLIVPFVMVTAGWCLTRSLGLTIRFGDLAGVLPLVLVVSSLPISIGGFGPREGSLAVLFPAFGLVSPAESLIAVTFSLLWYFLTVTWSIVGGLIYHFTPLNDQNMQADSHRTNL